MEHTDDMNFVLRYNGPAVESGTMSVYDAAAAMVAFSDFVVEAAKHTFGGDTEVRAEVQGFRHGSFATDLLFYVAGASAVLYPAAKAANEVLGTIQKSFDLYRHLKGDKPAKVEHRDGQQVAVTNQGGQVIVVNTPSLSLTLSEKGGQTVSSFVGDALKDGKGLQTVSIEHDGEPLASATETEASYFHRIDVDRVLFEGETKQALMIETPSFKDGNKWRFSDGQSTMSIAIEDPTFLQKVDDGEAFHKGDVLVAMVRWTQYQSGSQLKTERTIVEVIEHLERVGDQYPIAFPDADPSDMG